MVSINVADVKKGTNGFRSGFLVRTVRAFFNMQETTEKLLQQHPSEARLLLLVLISDVMFALSWTIKDVFLSSSPSSATLGSDLMMWIVLTIMMRTMLIYAMALVIGVVFKFMGSKVTIQETRIGVIWGVFIAAPIGLLMSELVAMIDWMGFDFAILQGQGIQSLPYWLGMIPFLWFVSKGAAVANRVNNTLPVFVAMTATAVAIASSLNSMAI